MRQSVLRISRKGTLMRRTQQRGQSAVTPFFRSAPQQVSRDTPATSPEKTEDPNKEYKEAAGKTAEAFVATPVFKKLVLEPMVLNYENNVLSKPYGKVFTGLAAASLVSASYLIDPAAPSFLLSKGVSLIPLDKIRPGLKMSMEIDGPIDKPTKVFIQIKGTF